MRRLATILAMVFVVATIGMGAAPGHASAATPAWQFHQLDADRYWDVATMDANQNGIPEQIWFDLDNDGRLDTHLYNSEGSESLLEVLTYDSDEDGTVEYMYLDTNQIAGYELLYVNANDDGYWDGPARAVGSSATVGVTFPSLVIRDAYVQPCIYYHVLCPR